MSHHTKDKGDLAVAKTIAHLLEHNIRVCLPLSEHLPFDLIAVMPDMKTLRRVQVKYRNQNELGCLKVPFSSNYYNSKRIYSKPVNLDHIDTYAIYCPNVDEGYYVPVAELRKAARTISLRIQPTKNSQQKGVWHARDFKILFKEFVSQRKPTRKQRSVSEQNEFVVAHVIADLMVKGWQVCVPNSFYIPFDLVAIAPDMTTLKRVCVSYENVQPNPYADQYAIYEPKTKTIRYLDANEVNAQDRELKNGRTSV